MNPVTGPEQGGNEAALLVREDERARQPVTSIQRAMAVNQVALPAAGYNHQQVLFRCPGGFSRPELVAAIAFILQEYPCLFAQFRRVHDVFYVTDGPISTGLLSSVACPLADADSTQQEQAIQGLLTADRRQGFDWEQEPLFRFQLIEFESTAAPGLLFSFHHILLDGRSTIKICRALLLAYLRLSNGLPLEPLLTPKQKSAPPASAAPSEAQKKGWGKQALHFPPYPQIPWLCAATPATQERGSLKVSLNSEQTDRINRFRESHMTGLHLFLLSIWCYVLSRYIATDAVCVDVIHHGHRNRSKTSDSPVGMAIEALPVIADCAPDQSIRDWLRQIVNGYINARDHGSNYAQTIQKHLPTQSLLKCGFMFEYDTFEQRIKKNWPQLEGFHLTLYEKTDLPLFLICNTQEDGLQLEIDFDRDQIAQSTAQSLLDLLLHCIEELTTKSIACLSDLSDPSEWKTPVQAQAVLPSLNHVLEASTLNTPDAVAIESPSRCLSYCELTQEVNRRAAFLAQAGITFGAGVCYTALRDFETTLNILAILRVGAYCIPLDPKSSIHHIDQIVNESQCEYFLAVEGAQQNPHAQLQIISVRLDFNPDLSPEQPWQESGAEDTAFLLYTSGSSGASKGVRCHHGGAVNEVTSLAPVFEIDQRTRMLQVANPAFDASIEELFTTFCGSGTLVTGYPDLLQTSWETFTETLQQQRITHLDLTTAIWHQWALWLHRNQLQLPPSLQVVIVGGERALKSTLECWFALAGNQTRWVNTYGLTETSIVSTAYKCDVDTFRQGPAEDLPIGQPIANTELNLLDPHGRHSPPGAVGELVIAGLPVCSGYLNPDSADSLLNFATSPAGRSFKTGDLARVDTDGNFLYIGRKDRQLKINGHRVEPAAIETILRTIPGVTDCFVCLRESPDHQKRLVAYLETSDSAADLLPQVQTLCAIHQGVFPAQPQCMLLHPFPLTPNGKVDAAKLPCPFSVNHTLAGATDEVVGEIQTKIIQAFAHTLKAPAFGLDDNFFAHGGDSLLTLSLLDELYQFGIHVNTQTIRKAPTPRLLHAFYLHQSHQSKDCDNTSDHTEAAPIFQRLNNTKQRDSIIVIHGVDGTFSGLSEVLASIDDSLQVFGIHGLREGTQPPDYPSIQAMVRHYADLIIENAPYSYLMGYSLGAFFAWEVGHELTRRGFPPRGLFLIEPSAFPPRNLGHQLSIKWGKLEGLLRSAPKAQRVFFKRKIYRWRETRLNHQNQRSRFAAKSPTYQYYMDMVQRSRASDFKGCIHLIQGKPEYIVGRIRLELDGWAHQSKQLHVESLDADHQTIISPQHAGQIASYTISSIVNDWLFQRVIKRNQRLELPRYLEHVHEGRRFCSIGAESTVDTLVESVLNHRGAAQRHTRLRGLNKQKFCAQSAERDGMALLSGNCLQLTDTCCALRVPLIVGLAIPLPSRWDDYVTGLPKSLRSRGRRCERKFTWDVTTKEADGMHFFHHYARPTAMNRHGRDAFYGTENEIKEILREGGFLLRVYENSQWVGAILIKPVTDLYELYIMGVKQGDYKAVDKDTVSALYWFSLLALNQRGIARVSLSTVAPYPSNALFQYKAKWKPEIDLSLTPRLPQFIYLNPRHSNCQEFFAGNEILFWEGKKLALMTGLVSSAAAQAKRAELTYLPSDSNIYSVNPGAEQSALAFASEHFQACLARQIWKLA